MDISEVFGPRAAAGEGGAGGPGGGSGDAGAEARHRTGHGDGGNGGGGGGDGSGRGGGGPAYGAFFGQLRPGARRRHRHPDGLSRIPGTLPPRFLCKRFYLLNI